MQKPLNDLLLEDLRLLSGLSLTAGNQCKQLSEIILKSTGYQISWQSLRRVLGFIKSENEPNTLTLNIIGRFLGYDSYVSYVNSKAPVHDSLSGSNFMDIMEIVYSNPLHPEKDLNYHFVCRRVSAHFYFNPNLLRSIPEQNFQLSAFQEYFIGRFPLIDLMEHGFQEILLNHLKVKDSADAKLFVYSTIYLHHYRNKRVNTNWLEMLNENVKMTKIHPFLIGRHFGILLHLNSERGNQRRVFDRIETELRNRDEFQQTCIIFTFVEFAIAAGLFELSLRLLNGFYPQPSKSNKWVEFGYHEVFKIFRFICLIQLGSFELANALKQQISTIGVAFYFRKTYELMFLESSVRMDENRMDMSRIKSLKKELYPNSISNSNLQKNHYSRQKS
jgi:hypothetical protein